jgi:hypothetical protein
MPNPMPNPMPNRPSRAVLLASVGLCCWLSAVPAAHAVLGGSPMTLPAGASSAVRAVQRAAVAAASGASSAASSASSQAPAASYTVNETTLASGTVVREYVSQSGTVFGIAWRGPQMPDLAALLGSYFPQYVEGVKAVRAARPGHGPVAVEQSGLVVRSGGHMGSFSGQAWLPQALPAGVSGAVIQ